MSIKVTAWVYDQRVGDHIAKSVLAKLADNANDDGVAWPSIKLISEQTEIPDRTVKRKLAWLADAGWISVSKRRSSSGRWGHNVYQLAVPWATVASGYRGPSEVVTVGQSLAQEPSGESSLPPEAAHVLAHAGTLVAGWIDNYRSVANEDPPKRTIGQMSRQIKQLLDGGAKPETVSVALALVVDKRLAPSSLPTVMLEAAAGPREPKQQQRFGRGLTADQVARVAQQLRQKEEIDERVGSNGGSGHSAGGLPPGSA
jgi:hypothetical protein